MVETASDSPARWPRVGAIEHKLRHAVDRRALLSCESFQERLLDYLAHRLERAQATVVSLDVFDTLLLRAPTSELTRFWHIANQIAAWARTDSGAVDPHDVLVARVLAARVSYRIGPRPAGCREGTLDEIHTTMLRALGIGEKYASETMSLELSYERSVLENNPALVRFANEQKTAGRRIVLLSDMYLSSEQIEGLVRELAPSMHIDLTISSADSKRPKSSRLAFPYLAKRLGCEVSEIFHIGDSLQSDYRAALQAGCAAAHLPVPLAEQATLRADFRTTMADLCAVGIDLSSWIRGPE